ncbi:MAG: 50S ribosomal protein L4 [bacterium]|nr:50S ribosomal protein L4 [bacterium]
MKSKIYNQKGQSTGEIELPETVFAVPWNPDLVHQVVSSMLSSRRTPVAHTKNRGEVRGGGRKPWQQKGTGRARHGSTRSPLWVGGGVTHGPRNDQNFLRKINKKMKVKALYSILSQKFRDNEVLFVDTLEFAAPKTAVAKETLRALGSIEGYSALKDKRTNAALIAMNKKNSAIEKSFRNFGNVRVEEARNLNPLELLNYKYLVIENPSAALKDLALRLAK